MSTLQNEAINELWRQGLHIHATRAERQWGMGQEFSLDSTISVPRTLRHLLEQCNREVIG